MLTLIWMTSLGLTVASVAALTWLIAARLMRERAERIDPGRWERLSRALLRYALGADTAPALSLRDRKLLLETALDAVQILRGAPKARLVALFQERGLDAALRRQALHGTLRARLTALETLRLFPDAATLAVLRRAERSRDLRIWQTALESRVAIGAGPDMLGLLELAARPGACRTHTMQDLVVERAKAAPQEAMRALQGRLPTPVRALIIRALGETDRVEALLPLRLALFHPEGQVRAAAAGAIGTLGFAAGADPLRRALADGDWHVRLKAVESFGRLGLWPEAHRLEPLLADPVWWVRFRAEEALRKLGDVGVDRLRETAAAMASGGRRISA